MEKNPSTFHSHRSLFETVKAEPGGAKEQSCKFANTTKIYHTRTTKCPKLQQIRYNYLSPLRKHYSKNLKQTRLSRMPVEPYSTQILINKVPLQQQDLQTSANSSDPSLQELPSTNPQIQFPEKEKLQYQLMSDC